MVECNRAAVNPPVLETLSLTRRFGEHTAVDSLTVSVKRGEVFGLLGPNGAGKTTTLKMLTTLLPPTSGRARIAGFDIVRQSADVRRVIGYVPQLLSADGTLTGYENLQSVGRRVQISRAADRQLFPARGFALQIPRVRFRRYINRGFLTAHLVV